MENVIESLLAASSMVITAHERPDGDALGSSLALRRILVEAGKRARVVGLLPLPERYAWLAATGEVEAAVGDWLSDAERLLILDCGAFDRVGSFANEAVGKVPVINIDHHDSNAGFGDVNWIDPHASCVGEMIFRLAKAAELTITPAAAQALWTALVTDTGGFAYANTTPVALRIGAELVELGAAPQFVHQQVYQSLPLKELRLTEHALSTLELHLGGRVASVMLSREDFSQLDCTPENATDIVNLPRSVKGVEVGLFFYELFQEDATKVSVRTVQPRDAIELCSAFGGGGHHRAAGCKIKGDADVAKHMILDQVAELWYSQPYINSR